MKRSSPSLLLLLSPSSSGDWQRLLCCLWLSFVVLGPPIISASAEKVTVDSGNNVDNRTSESHNESQALIQFRKPNVQPGYKSNVRFDPKGMDHLYAITDKFLDLIQPKEFPADIFVNNTEDITVILLNHKEELVKHYVGIVAVALIGLLLAALLPIIGLIFCLCRCAGRCGAHPEPYEKRHDACKRNLLGIFVSTFVIAILFGIVCGFVTNEYVEQGVTTLPENLNNSLDDVSLYKKNTKIEMRTLLVDNFAQLQLVLNDLLDKSGDIVQRRLAETSKASAIENLTNIVEGLANVHHDLADILQGARLLHEQVKKLDLGLDGVRNRLQRMLNSCTDSLCVEIRREYGNDALTVRSSLYKLPDVSAITQRVADFLHNDIENEVRKGKQSLDKISVLIQQAVNTTIPEIKSKLNEAGKELEKHYTDVAQLLDKIDETRGKKALHHVKFYSKEYGKYRYYVGLGLCCAVLLITTCFTFGLFCGFCGQKPHPYGDDSCSRVTGANFLIAGVYLVFLFSLFLFVFTTALFLIGGIAERVVCDPVQNSESKGAYQMADTFLPLQAIYPDENFSHLIISDILSKCHQNKTLYNVLKLESMFNISEVRNYKDHYRLDDNIQRLKEQISLDPAVLILTDQARRQLQELANSEFAKVDFKTFNEVLIQPVTSVSLVDVQMKLKEVISRMEYSQPLVAANLAHEADILASLQKEIVVNVSKTMASIRGHLDSLQNNMFFNKSNFRDVIHGLLQQAEQAQFFIQTKGRAEVIKLADEFAKNFTEYLDEYANHVEDEVQNYVGRCGPMSQAFNSSVISVCKTIVSPFNGFWASIGWCSVLFIPCIIFSIMLVPLYRKTDPYSGPLVESVHKKRRRNHHETYENRNGYIPDYMLGPSDDAARFRREAYPNSGHGSGSYNRVSPGGYASDPLYTPTAPSNWANNSGFSSSSNLASPGDYERPPPYYFPGPSGKSAPSRH